MDGRGPGRGCHGHLLSWVTGRERGRRGGGCGAPQRFTSRRSLYRGCRREPWDLPPKDRLRSPIQRSFKMVVSWSL